MSRSGKGRILAGLVSLLILACMLPVGAMAAWSSDTTTQIVYVAGYQFIDSGTLDLQKHFSSGFKGVEGTGKGTVVYDKDSNTLTLHDVNIDNLIIKADADVPLCFVYAHNMSNLTIKLVGTNSITYESGTGISIRNFGSVKIEGSETDTLTLTNKQEDCISAARVEVQGATLTLQQLGDHYGIQAWTMDTDWFLSVLTLQKGATVEVSTQGTQSAIYADGDIHIVGGSSLTVNGPSASSRLRASQAPAMYAFNNITVENSYLNVTGSVEAVNGITIQDVSDPNLHTSEVIVDGSTSAAAPITVTPAKGTWMQVHAPRPQADGALTVESYFDASQTFAAGHNLFNQSYVHIKEHTHTLNAQLDGDGTYHWQKCEVCKAEVNKQPHKLGGWEVANGKHWRACTVAGCNAIKDEAEHNYTELEYDANYHWKKCVCGEKGAKLEHNFTWTETKAPTETAAGSQHGVCQECKYEMDKPIPATGHTQHIFSTDWTFDETYHWHACTGVGVGCTEIADKAKHNFTWVTDKQPTETTPGSKHEECVCGYKKASVEIPPSANPPTPGSGTASANVPKTGDNTPIALWLMLLLASGTAITVLVRRKLYNR